MLGQRRRRWSSIETTFGRGLKAIYVGQLELVSSHSIDPVLFQCWASVVYDGSTLK